MEGEGGGVWGNECPFLKSDICTIYLPITLFMYVDCFFLYTSAGFSNFLKSSNYKNETKNSKLWLGEDSERVDLAHVVWRKQKTVSHEKVLFIPVVGSCWEHGVGGMQQGE